jgi:hypothetical protein
MDDESKKVEKKDKKEDEEDETVATKGKGTNEQVNNSKVEAKVKD